MRVGVVGAGRIGSGIARFLVRSGHEVVVSSRSGSGLEQLVDEIGVSAASPSHAVADSDIVVLSVPWVVVDDALAAVGGAAALDGRVVIDTTNQFGPRPGGGAGVLDLGARSAAATNALKAPGARWVKAFNTLTAGFQLDSAGRSGPDRVVMFFATDDEGAAPIAESLIHDAGFAPVRTGTLARVDVGHQEPKGDLYGEEFHLAQARERVEQLRGTPPSGTGRP